MGECLPLYTVLDEHPLRSERASLGVEEKR